MEKMIRQERTGSIIKSALFGLMALTLLALVLSIFTQVDAGERGVLLTFGKTEDKIFEPGLNFKRPFVQTVVKIDVRTQKLESGKLSAASKDLQIVSTVVTVNYHLEPSKVNIVYKNIGKLRDVEDKIIKPAIQEAVKASTARFTAEELITKRELVKDRIAADLEDRLTSISVIFENALITDFDFSPEFNKAIEAKVSAEQNALAAKNKLEQVKFEAQQTVVAAEASAKSIEIQGKALKESPQLVSLKVAEKWDGRMPTVMIGNNGATPLLDVTAILKNSTS